jgi:hypothetical protein
MMGESIAIIVYDVPLGCLMTLLAEVFVRVNCAV